MPQINSSLVADSAAAGLAATIEVQDSIEKSANPEWRHQFDLVDLSRDPLEDLEALLATAPTPSAESYVTAALRQRPDYRLFNLPVPRTSVEELRLLLVAACTPLQRAHYAGGLTTALTLGQG